MLVLLFACGVPVLLIALDLAMSDFPSALQADPASS